MSTRPISPTPRTSSLHATTSQPPTPPTPPAVPVSHSGAGGGGRASTSGWGPPEPPGGAGSSPPRRSIPALLAAGGLVTIVVALVLVFGLARPPELASLADEPEPALTAGIAWTQWEEGGSCLYTLDAAGTEHELGCGYDGEEPVAWNEDGIAMPVWGPRAGVEFIDPETGEVTETVAGEPEEWFGRDDGAVRGRVVDGTLTVTLRDEGVELWRVDVEGDYTVDTGVLSPDGEWVVLVDRSGRLLLVPSDGSAAPRVWHEVDQTWLRPVWEGTPLPARGDEG